MYAIKNSFITVCVAPELGGRIIEFSLDGKNFLFKNPSLKGVENNQPTDKWDGKWLNYGGEKIWPAPQGWKNPATQWAGPPDPYIDGGYFRVVASGENFVELESPAHPQAQLRITRRLEILPDCAGVEVKAKLYNLSDETKKWSIWPVAQMAQTSDFCEASLPAAAKDWKIMHGLVNNPQYVYENTIARAKYKYLVGKIGALTPAGWISFGDLANGRLFAATFKFDKSATYPDGTSAQIWTSGRGSFWSRNTLKTMPDDIVANPPYTELEILSPLEEIGAGAFAEFSYRLCACTVAKSQSVQSVDKILAVTKHLSKSSGNRVEFAGGFFAKGTLEIQADLGGRTATLLHQECSPLCAVEISAEIPANSREILAVFFDISKNSTILETLKL